MERALCVATGELVEAPDLPAEVVGTDAEGAPTGVGGTYDEQMQNYEAGLLRRSLAASNRSQKDAATGLGLTYDRFRHLLRKHEMTGS